jgi:hypothetical protein
MSAAIPIALLAAMATGSPVIPRLTTRSAAQPAMQAGNFTLTATPATITFNATNPGTAPVVAGSATASITWQVLSGGNTWSLKVQANAPAFANCPTVPISAVTVSCASASSGVLGGTATCAGSFPLSTTPVQVAGGAEGLISYNYSVTINFTLADRWKYIAETNPACSISLTYTANVP